MPARKTKGKTVASNEGKVLAEERAAAESAAAAATIETVAGAADVVHGEDEAAAAAMLSASSDAAAQRAARDAAEGAAVLSIAEQVAAGGAITSALSSDEFRRGMELAGIAGQVQAAADLLGAIAQPTLAAFLGRTSRQLHVLAVEALGRATEGAVAAHGAEHLASELAALGFTEMSEGRDEYTSSEALGAASAEMAASAVRSVAEGAAELAAAKALDGMAGALAKDGAHRTVPARRTSHGSPGKAAVAATPPAPKPAQRAASKRAPRKPSRPQT